MAACRVIKNNKGNLPYKTVFIYARHHEHQTR